MRVVLALAAMLAGCATAPIASTAVGSEIAISLRRDSENSKPTLLVKVTNTFPHQICIWRDTLQNPYSYEMDLKMRDANKRAIRYNKTGYIDEPLEGVVQLEPGQTVEGRFYLHPRFKLRNQGRPFPQGMSVRVSFLYHRCDDSKELRARSAWQPLE